MERGDYSAVEVRLLTRTVELPYWFALTGTMSLIFKTIQTEGIAELSYLLGDDDEGVGAVFDPRPDCDVYVEMAREAGLAITHIFETHIPADLISGSRELCARLESANIFVSLEE